VTVWDKLMAQASGRRAAQLRQSELNERRRQLLLRLLVARDELGRWPAPRDWDHAGADHLSSRAYSRNFGSWSGASRAAARLESQGGASVAPVYLWGWL
jgi:hypothetical protein